MKGAIDESKLRRQEQFIENWGNNKGVGTLEAVTAFGKTYTTILIMKRMLLKIPSRTFIIVVPTTSLKDQWESILLSEGINSRTALVYVINGLTIHNEKMKCSCLILDEIHLYLNGEIFSRVFDLIEYSFILGLSATIDKNSPGYNLLRVHCPIIDTITQQEAINNNWVAEYKEFVLSIDLTDEEKEEYNEIDKRFKSYFSKFNFDFNLAMICGREKVTAYTYAKSMGWNEDMSQTHPWSPKRIAFYSVQFNREMARRKEFLYNLPIKRKLCVELVNKLNLKTIIFSESTDFADELAKDIGSKAEAYHSNLKTQIRRVKNVKGVFTPRKFGKDRLKKEILANFEDLKHPTTVLVTAKALNQGTDLPSAQVGLIPSYNSSNLTSIQRRGRVIRKYVNSEGVEKKSLVIYMAVRGSQEESWLRKALQYSTPIWTDSIDYILANAFSTDVIIQDD